MRITTHKSANALKWVHIMAAFYSKGLFFPIVRLLISKSALQDSVYGPTVFAWMPKMMLRFTQVKSQQPSSANVTSATHPLPNPGSFWQVDDICRALDYLSKYQPKTYVLLLRHLSVVMWLILCSRLKAWLDSTMECCVDSCSRHRPIQP